VTRLAGRCRALPVAGERSQASVIFMRRLALLAVTACSSDPSHVVGFYEVTDDGTTVQVTGCYDGRNLACSEAPPAGVTMTATMDGSARDVPLGTLQPLDGDACGFSLFATTFAANFPEATDPQIDIELDGERVTTRELPAFSVQTPPDAVHRSAGPITASYDVVLDATAIAFLDTECPAGTSVNCGIVLSPANGMLPIDFARADIPTGATACSHTIIVEQSVNHSSRDPVDGTVSRMVLAKFSSLP
jgi:hypothetical protein